jgi:prepilin-type processing-associated H-X9-DG protein
MIQPLPPPKAPIPLDYAPRPPGASTRRILTIIGYVTGGLVVLAGLLAIAILIPAMAAARERANRVQCAANLKSIGISMLIYNNDYRSYPRIVAATDNVSIATDLFYLVHYDQNSNYQLVTGTFCCPSTRATPDPATPTAFTFIRPDSRSISYGLTNPWNPAPGFRWSASAYGDNAIASDWGKTMDAPGAGRFMSNHNGAGGNLLYNDGHVDWCINVMASRLSGGQSDDITTPTPDPLDCCICPTAGWP